MTQEEKARKYDEALEIARDYYKANLKLDKADENLVLEDIFPELAESDDGETKKSLMQYIWNIYHREYCPPTPSIETCDKWLAWLEKQGEYKVWTDNDYDSVKSIEYLLHELDNHNFDDWFNQVLRNNECKSIAKQIYTDKEEPKFKVGDWITDGKALLYITKYESDYGYELKAIDVEVFHGVSPELVEANYHLWTIQDAKNGDVLAVDSKPFIYNGSKNEVTVGAYCGFNTKHKFSFAYNYVINQNITPATKEQRDLLFSKMEEAGYEWDWWKKRCIKKNKQKQIKMVSHNLEKEDLINYPNNCFSQDNDTYDQESRDEWKRQRLERGFDDTELWNLDATIIRFVLPRLKAFAADPTIGYPCRLEQDYPDCKDYNDLWWNVIIPEMIIGLEEYLDDSGFDDEPEGMKLFFKYFTALWT